MKTVFTPLAKTVVSLYTRRPKCVLLLIFSIAVIARLSAMVYLESHIKVKSYDVHIIADNIVQGQGFSFPFAYGLGNTLPSAYKSPLYVYFLVLMQTIFGKTILASIVVQTVQAIIAGFTCIVFVYTFKLFKRDNEGYIAGFVYAILPSSIIQATRMHEINLSILLMAWLIYALCHLYHHCSASAAVRTGMAVGLGILAEPSFALFCLVSSGFMLVTIQKPMVQKLQYLCIVILISILALTPWSVRNYLTFHQFVFVKNVKGLNLWIGNNPNANGGDRIPFEKGTRFVYMTDSMDPDLKKEVLQATSESEKDKILQDAAGKYMAEHPLRTLALAVKKARLLWIADTIHPFAQNAFYRISQFTLFVLGLLGMVLNIRNRQLRFISILLLLFLLSHTVNYCIFFVLPRYRLMADPVLLFGAVLLLERTGFHQAMRSLKEALHLSPS